MDTTDSFAMPSTSGGPVEFTSSLLATNAEIFEANNLQPIATTLRRRRLTFAGHCYRSFESAPRPIMDVLFFSLRGTRTRGNRSNYTKLLSEDRDTSG